MSKALKDWNMIESPIVNEWIKIGEERGEERGKQHGKQLGRDEGRIALATSLLNILKQRFGRVSKKVKTAIGLATEFDILQGWITNAVKANSLPEFCQLSGI
jgi:predicted transposase YdaD